jgi:hypothetical protein
MQIRLGGFLFRVGQTEASFHKLGAERNWGCGLSNVVAECSGSPFLRRATR